MIQIRIRCVINYLFRMHYVIWSIFQNGRLQKDDKTLKILWQLNNYVHVIEAFYTYNLLVGYGA